MLERVPLSGSKSAEDYDESWLQDLLYRFPKSLPIDEIDSAYADLIPVCREMMTPAGPIDVVYITPAGKLVVLEAKLWRNPEARRKVVGQVLDYAKELSKFDFERLNAEVKSARRREAAQRREGLIEIGQAHIPDFDEARFCDNVSRALRHGEFLLLIVGDGIREGVGAIASFLEAHGTLMFTFGLVEMAVYRTPAGERLVHPRVLAQSTIFQRIVVQVSPQGLSVEEVEPADAGVADEEAREQELAANRSRFEAFWKAFLDGLVLDDAGQPVSPAYKSYNQYFYLSGKKAWISAFVAPATHTVGVYLTVSTDVIGDRLFEGLDADRAQIIEALGVPVDWKSNLATHQHTIVSRQSFEGEFVDSKRPEVLAWLRDRTNRFITVFRPRIRDAMEALEQESR